MKNKKKNEPKRQHFVPKVYLKYWCLDKKKKKLYYYKKFPYEKMNVSIKNVCIKKDQYTLDNQKYEFIINRYPKLSYEIAQEILEILKTNNCICKYNKIELDNEQKIMDNSLFISAWKFYNPDGKEVTYEENKKLEQIKKVTNYSIEHRLNEEFESIWDKRLDDLIPEFENNVNSEILLSSKRLDSLLDMFLVTMLRNPNFDYFENLERILNAFCDIFCDIFESGALDKNDFLNKQNSGFRKGSLYESLNKDGVYKALYSEIKKYLNILILVANEGEGDFITSDNPAFLNRTCIPESSISDYLIFPLSPKCVMLMYKNKSNPKKKIEKIGIVGKNNPDIKKVNRWIMKNSKNFYISLNDDLGYII